MAADIATLSLKLDAQQMLDGLGKVRQSTDATAQASQRLTLAQKELVARVDKLVASANSIDIQNKKAVASYLQEVATVRALAQQMGVLDLVQTKTAQSAAEVAEHAKVVAAQMKALHTETAVAANVTTGLGTATGLTRGGLNSMRASLTSMAAALVGTAPGVGQFTSVLGTMALGSGLMVGVLAGMSAIAFAWDKIGGAARKAAKDQDDAIESLRRMQREEDAGPAGETAIKTNEGAKRIGEINAQIAAQRERASRFTPGSEGRKAADAILAELEKEYAERASVVRRGAQTVRRIEEESFAQSITGRLSFNQKDAAARAAALERVRQDTAEYARLLKLPETAANSAKIAKVAAEMQALNDALHPKTTGSRVTRTQDARDLQEITRALQEVEEQAQRTADARTKAVADAEANTAQELAEADLLLSAAHDGEAAYNAQQREIEILNRLTAEGLRLGDAEYEQERRRIAQLLEKRDAVKAATDAFDKQREAEKRAVEQAVREQERRVRQTERAVGSAIERGLEDVFARRNPLPGLVASVKSAVLRGISEALAAKVVNFVLPKLGFETAPDKQLKAAQEMIEASKRQYDAALIMSGKAPKYGTGDSGAATQNKWQALFTKAGQYATAAVGGYGTGYTIGTATQSGTLGAIGGALTGAKLGAIAGPVGSAVGAVAGFVGGIIGAADAAEAARKRLRELKEAFQNTFDALKAELDKDTLGQAVAQVKAQYDAATKQFEEANTVLNTILAGAAAIQGYAATLKQLQDMEAKRIAQLEQEAAILAKRTLEDYQARRDAAIPGNEKAEAIADYNRKLDREREDLIRSFGDSIDEQEKLTLAMADQAFAAEKAKFATEQNTKAVDALTTALHNAPTGYKVEPLIYQFATPRPRDRSGLQPSSPNFPMSPLSPPQLSAGGKVLNVHFNIDGTKTTRTLVKDIATELKKVVTEALGSNADVSEGWGLLT